jgi:hypothetical protein
MTEDTNNNRLNKEDIEQWNNFIDELKELQNQYNIELGEACDCCFEYHKVNDKKLRLPYYPDDLEIDYAHQILEKIKIDEVPGL